MNPQDLFDRAIETRKKGLPTKDILAARLVSGGEIEVAVAVITAAIEKGEWVTYPDVYSELERDTAQVISAWESAGDGGDYHSVSNIVHVSLP